MFGSHGLTVGSISFQAILKALGEEGFVKTLN